MRHRKISLKRVLLVSHIITIDLLQERCTLNRQRSTYPSIKNYKSEITIPVTHGIMLTSSAEVNHIMSNDYETNLFISIQYCDRY